MLGSESLTFTTCEVHTDWQYLGIIYRPGISWINAAWKNLFRVNMKKIKKRIGTWLWETVCGELLDGKYMDLR